MNIISLVLWQYIKRDLVIGANGTATYEAVISEIQQVSSSEIYNIVDELKKMSLIKEPGKYVETSGSQVIENNCCIVGYGSAPININYIVAQ